MTAPATTRRAGPFLGNGVTTSFPFTFKVFATSDIAVTKTSAGIDTVLALGVDYSVTLNGDQDASPGGTITHPISGTPLAVGQSLVAVGSLPYDQTADLPSGGNYRAIVIENALDRTVMQVQQLAEEVGRSLTLPASAAIADTELPTPEANKVIGWNASGDGLVNLDASDLASVVVAGTSYTDVFNGTGAQTSFALTANPGSVNALDVAISGVSKVNGVDFLVSGTTLTFTAAPAAGTGNVAVRYVAALPVGTADAQDVSYASSVPSALPTNVKLSLDRLSDISVFQFLNEAQIADVLAYTYALDVSTPVQTAIDVAWTTGRKLRFPPGGYSVSSLFISETGAQASRILDMEGVGCGNPFSVGASAGTVFKSTTDDPIFAVYTSAVSTSTGTLRIKGITFWGDSTTPVVFLKAFYGTSEFSHNVVRQEGVGDGMEVQVMATGSIHDCYFLNRDLVTFGLGAARVGVGLWINQQYDAGLQTVYKCSSRGFLTGVKIGADSGTAYTYNASLYDSEVSATYNGVILTALSRATRVENTYCEGGEGGVAFQDDGDYSVITRCYTFPTYSVHLKSTSFTYGNVYSDNHFLANTTANQVLIDVTSSGSPSGPGKTVTNNHLSFGGSGGSIAGVIGLRINGTDPRLNLAGNTFFPRGNWTGGAGTLKVSDLSSSSDTTVGSGVYGLKTAMSTARTLEAPMLGRGAINLAVEPVALNNTNVSAGVLTLGEMSVFTFTPTSNVAITSFAAPNLPDKTFSIHVTATAFTVTFTHGALLKLTGSANIATGANGAWLTFQVKAGGVAWLTSHVAY